MSTKVKNEYAFPSHSQSFTTLGMTLRDYFAAQVMQAFITGFATRGETSTTDNELARAAYMMADEMLKARGDA